jgi:hypothetical protein
VFSSAVLSAIQPLLMDCYIQKQIALTVAIGRCVDSDFDHLRNSDIIHFAQDSASKHSLHWFKFFQRPISCWLQQVNVWFLAAFDLHHAKCEHSIWGYDRKKWYRNIRIADPS